MLFYIILYVEFFHIISHVAVLLRLTEFTVEYLKSKRFYFVIDLLTPILACYYIGYYPLLLLPHTLGHLYYVITWNTSYYAQRIIEWSCIEYKGKYLTEDFYLTVADILSHSYILYLLCK